MRDMAVDPGLGRQICGLSALVGLIRIRAMMLLLRVRALLGLLGSSRLGLSRGMVLQRVLWRSRCEGYGVHLLLA